MMEFSEFNKGALINNPFDIKIIAWFILELMVEKFSDLFDPAIAE